MHFSTTAYALLSCAASALLSAQTATNDNSGSRLTTDPDTGAFHFSWWGVSGRTYFIQHNPDLHSPWHFLPVIEQGHDETISYGFTVNSPSKRFFLRLQHTDANSDGDPYSADFDADGIPNGWEIEHDLNPFNASDASTVVSNLTNLELYRQSLGDVEGPALINTVSLVVYTP